MTHPAIDVQRLVKRYGRTTAVDDLSLVVEAGTVLGLLGPNGAGKTTTVECLEGYRRPDSGVVRVLGLDPGRDAAALRPRVGVMLQTGGVYPGVRPEEMLRHLARLHSSPLPVEPLIEALGLDACRRTPYRRLSGGEQQRLSLAMALVGRPELVLLDEPTAGLDPQARHAVWDVVRQLRHDGVTVLVTTHLMDEAERLCDRVVVVDAGRVVADGSPAELTSAGAENTLRFSAPVGLDVSSLEAALPEGVVVTEDAPGAYRVLGPLDPRLLATVTTWCAAHDVMPEGFSLERRTLEDVFLELTGRALR